MCLQHPGYATDLYHAPWFSRSLQLMLRFLNVCPDNGWYFYTQRFKTCKHLLVSAGDVAVQFSVNMHIIDNINKIQWYYTELFKPYTNVGPTPALPTKERAGDTQLLGFGSL